mmetsp:Transcript_4110/g.6997  ORF Transcript_4110/g.6997 Transcript_4110/m.6997 type:complete len:285 (+) Transcript_4110:192-1046(+)|eukprot:CAMPEP_0198203514 /NCGR_PEP_ID=MMETSP1445-20131203/6809_1 /TAXON_ID=36898 /ORGANISM="Pyramimonas sp., Strain CCMP2087" /LENGTH=284 /DNA_ID=CAMNT_0043874941 /DNA_START=143 /DNA_END=997 /DNA_ORIENTATION=-
MPFNDVRREAQDRQGRREYRQQVLGLSAYDRHNKFVNDYVLFYGKSLGAPQQAVKTDHDTVRESYRFLRSSEDDQNLEGWEQKLAKRYYEKLFKEYCLADLSRYKEGAVGMRWRVQAEVVKGKGQFICGNKRCDNRLSLASYEVNFAYKEAGENKNALVKLRVCPDCAYKLNYKREKKLKKARKHGERGSSAKRSRRAGSDAADTEGGGGSGDGSPKRTKTGGGEAGGDDDASAGQADHEGARNPAEPTDGEKQPNNDIWCGQPKDIEPTKDEEFEQYFMDMFL